MSSEGKLSKACDACKSKKIKCDKSRPTCGYCKRHNLTCNFSYNKRPGLKPGYGKQITERISELEVLVDEYKGSISQIEVLRQRIEDLESRMQAPQSQQGPISGYGSVPAAIGSVPATVASYGTPQKTEPLPKIINSLPDKSVCQRLLQIYLEDLYNIIPLVHPLVTIPMLLHHIDDPTPTLYAITLLTLRLCPDDVIAHEDIPAYYKFCRGEILSRVLGMQDLECSTALALLSFDLLGTNSHEFDNAFSLLVNGCEKMGLFDEAANNSYTFKQDELQLVWTVYTMDRINLLVNQQSVLKVPTRRLPIPFEKSFSGGQLEFVSRRSLHNPVDSQYYDSNCFYLETVHFIEQCYNLVLKQNQSPMTQLSKFTEAVTSLRGKVETWKKGLPSGYNEFLSDSNVSFKDSLTVHDVLLHSCYHLFQLLATSCFLFVPDSSTAKLMHQCVQTARKIVELSRNYMIIFNNDKLYQLGFLYIISLWAAARVGLLHTVHFNEEVHKDFDFVVERLNDISSVWKLAGVYADALTKMKQDYVFNRRQNFYSFQNQMLKGYDSAVQSPITEHFLYGSTDAPVQLPKPGGVFDILKVPV